MSDKAMKRRHWERIENLTGYSFDIGMYWFIFEIMVRASQST